MTLQVEEQHGEGNRNAHDPHKQPKDCKGQVVRPLALKTGGRSTRIHHRKAVAVRRAVKKLQDGRRKEQVHDVQQLHQQAEHDLPDRSHANLRKELRKTNEYSKNDHGKDHLGLPHVKVPALRRAIVKAFGAKHLNVKVDRRQHRKDEEHLGRPHVLNVAQKGGQLNKRNAQLDGSSAKNPLVPQEHIQRDQKDDGRDGHQKDNIKVLVALETVAIQPIVHLVTAVLGGVGDDVTFGTANTVVAQPARVVALTSNLRNARNVRNLRRPSLVVKQRQIEKLEVARLCEWRFVARTLGNLL
mmetsp:Transcript_8729/g.27834  ORF Transcript_8729/g.27834 Transcript_8729/m.27834 type:complete len:299 (+) Transcript_8729:2764-3660(+)